MKASLQWIYSSVPEKINSYNYNHLILGFPTIFHFHATKQNSYVPSVFSNLQCMINMVFTALITSFKCKSMLQITKHVLPSFFSMLLWLLVTQISVKHTLTHLPKCSLGTMSPNFLRLPFQYFHWSPGHMAIYKLLWANYHSRKHVTSHTFVMSRSPVMKTFSWIILCICNL